MAEEIAPVAEVVEAPTLNIEDAVADIADSLDLAGGEDEIQNAAKQEEAALTAEADKVEAEKGAESTKVVDPADQAPDTWKKEAKDAWAGVPPAVKEDIRRREAEYASYRESAKQPTAVAQTLEKVMEPYLPMLEKYGINAWDNISNMMKVQQELLFGAPEAKQAIIHNMAKAAGLTLEGSTLSAPADATQQYISRLEQRLTQLEGGVKGVTSTVQTARRQELENHIVAFANDTVNHPYFAKVADGLTHLIATGAAATLQEAYDLAVMANPETRALVIDSEAGRLAQQRASAATARAAKAQQASKANVRSNGRGKPAPAATTIDDTLKDALADINSR